MAQNSLSTIDFFSKGLVGISHLESDQENQLPSPGRLPPPALTHRSELDELFSFATLDGLIDEAISPLIADPNILLPAKFQSLQLQVIEALRLASTTSNFRNSQALDEATQILRDDNDLRIFVNQYRNALCAG